MGIQGLVSDNRNPGHSVVPSLKTCSRTSFVGTCEDLGIQCLYMNCLPDMEGTVKCAAIVCQLLSRNDLLGGFVHISELLACRN